MHKKLIVALVVSAFGVISTLQAADAQKPADAKAPAANEKTMKSADPLVAKTATIADQAKAAVSSSDDCCSDGSCSPARKVAMSPRGAELARK